MSASRLRALLDRVLGAVLAGLMLLMVLNVLWGIFSRQVLGAPSAFTEETARYLLIWVGLLGAAHAAGQRRHLAIDLLPHLLRGDARRRLAILLEGVVALVTATVLIYGGGLLVRLTLELEQRSAALGAPLGGVYLALPLAGGLILIYAVLHILELGGEERAA